MRALLAIAFPTFLLTASPAAPAEDLTGSVEEGRRLALGVCAECHEVAEKQRPPRPPVPNVPSFYDLSDDPAVTPYYLRAFFRTPHRNMPNIMLSRDETDNIIAYIQSLKGKKKR